MDEGYIKIYRNILKWEWYDDIPTKVLFLHLLLTVNYTDGRWHGIEVKKGCRITSLSKLSKECGLSVQQVRTAISKLKSTQEITHNQHTDYTFIQVNNWDKYQVQSTQIATRKQHGSNTEATTIEEGNKERKKENDTTATDLLLFFNSTTGVNLKLTDKKREQIRNRLKTFSIEEIQRAIKNRMTSKWHIENGWTQDWDSLFCNDEKIDKMLNIQGEAPVRKVHATTNYNF